MTKHFKHLIALSLALLMALAALPVTAKEVKADELEPAAEVNEVAEEAEDVLNTWTVIEPDYREKTGRAYYSEAGVDRYETAALLAIGSYDVGPQEVIIVTGQKFPDALAAAAYAGAAYAPILLSRLDRLSQPTKDYITQTNKIIPLKKVTVIGGEFQDSFYNDLKALGFSVNNGKVRTIAGKDRYETAELVTKEVLKRCKADSITVPSVAVATGASPYDALSFGPWSSYLRIPILLVNSKGQASATTKTLIEQFPNVFLLGSEKIVPDDCLSASQKQNLNYIRLAGKNRYETSQKIAIHFIDRSHGGSYYHACFVDGTAAHYVDALAASHFSYGPNGVFGIAPIILTHEGSSAEADLKDFIVSKFAGSQTNNYSFWFIGWAAKGKSSEYNQLVKWIESKD